MHVPDGFLDAHVSVATGAVAAAAVAVSLRGARRELQERAAPLAGLVAAFVFAVQMLNFPVGAGTSGHLLGGALAAILVGPFTGVLCLTVVLLMQAMLFADGGLTALGTNITLMGVVTVATAYAVFRGLMLLLPEGRGSVSSATFVAALVSVPAAALAFCGLYAIGGTADVSLGAVVAAMSSVHALIGLGEAAITTATVGAVLAVRPDLVHAAARHAPPRLEIRGAGSPPAPAPARPLRPVWLTGLAVTVICAAFVSFYASASPDGLEKVAADEGIAAQEGEHDLAGSPLAGYGVADVADERLSTALAGLAGVAGTLAAGYGVLLAVRRSPAPGAARDAPDVGTPAPGGGPTPGPPAGQGLLARCYVPAVTPVHALPAHCKILAALGFVLAAVATPPHAVWSLAGHGALLAAVAVAARVPPGLMVRRMAIELPFVAFALLLPFLAAGPRVTWLGLSLSQSGLWDAWNILAKGTLGVAAAVLLAATTDVHRLLLGLQRLRLPTLLVQIASFMVRYADVVTGELRRMRVARESRGFTARGVRHWGVLARTAGALFIRCYERGERVHLAMLSRGYTGTLPALDTAVATRADWAPAAALPAAALSLCLLGWTL